MESFRENSEENSNSCISSNTCNTNKPKGSQVRVNEEVKETILRMMRNNCTSREISSATGLNIRTVQRWISKLQINPEAKVTKVGKKANPNMERRREVELSIASNNSLTAIEIVESLSENLKCHPSTVRRDLKAIGYTRKRLKTVVAERNSARVTCNRFRARYEKKDCFSRTVETCDC